MLPVPGGRMQMSDSAQRAIAARERTRWA